MSPFAVCKGLFATVNSFDPHNSLFRPRGWPAASQGNRGCQAALQIWAPWYICTPFASCVLKEEVSSTLSLLSQTWNSCHPLYSDFLTSPCTLSLPLSSFLATTVSLFPFTAKLLERPVYTCCLPSSPPISSSTHCFLTSVLRRTALTQVMTFL